MTFSTHTSGPDDAPRLVFLHGFMGSAADFEAVVAPLEARFQCVRVDLPGHGDAPLPEGDLSLVALAEALRRDVLAQSPRPTTLLGYSMGGRIALQTALDYPDAVDRTVLVSTSPGIRDLNARRRRRGEDRRRAEQIRADFDGFLDAWYRLPIFGDLTATAGYGAMLERRRRNVPEAMARVVVELSPGRQPSNWHRLAQLRNASWIVGEDDPKYLALGRRLEEDGHQVLVASGAAHAVHVERPKWLSQQLDPSR